MEGFEDLRAVGKAVSIMLSNTCDPFILNNSVEDDGFFRVFDEVDQLLLSNELAHESFVVHFFLQGSKARC